MRSPTPYSKTKSTLITLCETLEAPLTRSSAYTFDGVKENETSWQPPGIEPRVPGLSCQCSDSVLASYYVLLQLRWGALKRPWVMVGTLCALLQVIVCSAQTHWISNTEYAMTSACQYLCEPIWRWGSGRGVAENHCTRRGGPRSTERRAQLGWLPL